jgi:PLP dependent protein
MNTTKIHLQAVRSRISDACLLSQRNERDIVLVAVTKAVAPETIRGAYAAGQRHFGESYAQEGLAKMAELADLDIVWHYIGPIQSNKTRPIAENFDWVHGVDRLKIAERLSEQRLPQKPPLEVCLQVNISAEPSKSGLRPEEVPPVARAIAALPHLRLRGLMTIPEPAVDRDLRRRQFEAVASLQAALVAQGLALDTLSMGMSDDFEEAIAAGSTLLRIGTAIFGPRPTAARTTRA